MRAHAYAAFLAEHEREPSGSQHAPAAERELAAWISNARLARVSEEAMRHLDAKAPGWARPRATGISADTWALIRRLVAAREAGAPDRKAERWLVERRSLHRGGTLAPILAAVLAEQLGPRWAEPFDGDRRAEQWALRIAAFRVRHGHFPRQRTAVPRSPDEVRLGCWLRDTRGLVRDGKLTDRRVALLTDVLGEEWQGHRRRP